MLVLIGLLYSWVQKFVPTPPTMVSGWKKVQDESKNEINIHPQIKVGVYVFVCVWQ